MENRLEVQDIQGDELYMELTPEELQELEQVKGGFSGSNDLTYKPLANGIPVMHNPCPYGVPVLHHPFPLGVPVSSSLLT